MFLLLAGNKLTRLFSQLTSADAALSAADQYSTTFEAERYEGSALMSISTAR